MFGGASHKRNQRWVYGVEKRSEVVLAQGDVEVPDVGVVEIEADEADAEHEVSALGEVDGERDRLSVDLVADCPGDDLLIKCLQAQAGEEDDEDDQDCDRNCPAGRSLVVRVLLVTQVLLGRKKVEKLQKVLEFFLEGGHCW